MKKITSTILLLVLRVLCLFIEMFKPDQAKSIKQIVLNFVIKLADELMKDEELYNPLNPKL